MKTVLTLALVLVFAVPGAADHCVTYTSSAPEIDTGATPLGRIYVENNMAQPCCWDWWIYEESNGIEGLQRADEVVDDTCHGRIHGDTIIL